MQALLLDLVETFIWALGHKFFVVGACVHLKFTKIQLGQKRLGNYILVELVYLFYYNIKLIVIRIVTKHVWGLFN